jgi:putative SOS response-associated peptidase YedK
LLSRSGAASTVSRQLKFARERDERLSERAGWVRTFTILTTPPNEIVAPLHDRMPLILSPVDYDRWLDKECDPAQLIRPFSTDEMVTWPVSTRVNKPENDDAAILDRLVV